MFVTSQFFEISDDDPFLFLFTSPIFQAINGVINELIFFIYGSQTNNELFSSREELLYLINGFNVCIFHNDLHVR